MSLSICISKPPFFTNKTIFPSSSTPNPKSNYIITSLRPHPSFLPNPNHFHPSPQPVSKRIAKCALSSRPRPPYIPNHIPDPNYVRIFDTTLRDGEQSPGATMTSSEKIAVARQLFKLGVDIIEAGFPASSPDDLEAVKMIAKEVGNQEDQFGYCPVICGLARCRKADIDKAWEAVQYAKRPRIHTFIATSEIHLVHKLKMTREEVVKTAREMVAYARSLGCVDIEFSPEDAGREPVLEHGSWSPLSMVLAKELEMLHWKRYPENF